MNKNLMHFISFRHVVSGDALVFHNRLRFVSTVKRSKNKVFLEFTDEPDIFHCYNSNDLVTNLTVGAA